MQPQPDHSYSWDDYLQWEGDQRWELIQGVPYLCSSPSVLHQAICLELAFQFRLFLEGKPCRVFVAPLDVKLSHVDVVQPDVLVICHEERLRKSHVDGPPDLVIEVASPSTFRHDRLRKLNLYAGAGISEYWIVNPHPFLVEVHRNNKGIFEVAGAYSEKDNLSSPRFPDLKMDLGKLFRALPPDMVKEPEVAYSTW
jgi:Uma2 family endonuclease